jgi:hypothetical protein
MIVSRTEIFEHDRGRLFYRSETTHDWWPFHRRRNLTVKVNLTVFDAMWGFDYEVSWQVHWCFSGISDLHEDELGDRSLEFKING